MKKLLLSLLILSFASSLIVAKPDYKDEEKAVREAAGQFYSALNALFIGEVSQMKEVWSHKDDISYMGPEGEFFIGWDKVLKLWESTAAMKLGGEVKPGDMHIILGRDIAIVQNYEKGANVDADGNPQMVSIRASNIFRKEDGKWKMISHQTDMLSFLTN